MTPEQAAAFVYAQAVSALSEIEAMKAENYDREQNGFAHFHDATDFRSVQSKFIISHNGVLEVFRDSNNQ